MKRLVIPAAASVDCTDEQVRDWRIRAIAMLVNQGFRICHKASARKHLKRNNCLVIGMGDGRFAWRRNTYMHRLQHQMSAQFIGNVPNLRVSLPHGAEHRLELFDAKVYAYDRS